MGPTWSSTLLQGNIVILSKSCQYEVLTPWLEEATSTKYVMQSFGRYNTKIATTKNTSVEWLNIWPKPRYCSSCNFQQICQSPPPAPLSPRLHFCPFTQANLVLVSFEEDGSVFLFLFQFNGFRAFTGRIRNICWGGGQLARLGWQQHTAIRQWLAWIQSRPHLLCNLLSLTNVSDLRVSYM